MSGTSTSLTTSLADRYTVERLIGHGGMATVHLAEERKHRRKVAIKVLKHEFGASVGAERFMREIGIAARLSHPHIVPLIDSGESDGALYYVSPYISGGSLRDRLNRDKKLPIDDALRIAHEVGAALDYAHRSGFVHRDVKPENILFADDHALLADFGIAHVVAAPSEEPGEKVVLFRQPWFEQLDRHAVAGLVADEHLHRPEADRLAAEDHGAAEPTGQEPQRGRGVVARDRDVVEVVAAVVSHPGRFGERLRSAQIGGHRGGFTAAGTRRQARDQ